MDPYLDLVDLPVDLEMVVDLEMALLEKLGDLVVNGVKMVQILLIVEMVDQRVEQ